MKKKICFCCSWGHGQITNGVKDNGAVRKKNGKITDTELRITTKSVKYIISKLLGVKKRTYVVQNLDSGTTGRHLSEQNVTIDKLRNKYRTVAFDYHVNAGGGKGVEIYIPKANKYSLEIAEDMMKSMMKAGIPLHSCNNSVSGAIKFTNDLMFLNGAGPRFLFECGYIDSDDYKRFDTDGELQKMNDIFIEVLLRYYNKHK